jgi:hypothetical protein
VRKLLFIWAGLVLCGLLGGISHADTFELADGQTLTGDVVSFNEEGIIFRLPDEKYSDRIAWGKFSQTDLRKLHQNPRMTQFVEPFIEITEAERLRQAEIRMNPVPRLSRPEPRSLIASMFSSGIGVLALLLLYAANIYAAYEVAIFRAQPVALVCGVAAVLPFIGPIIFLSMPTRMPPAEADPTEATGTPAQIFAVVPPPGSETAAAAAQSGGVRLAQADPGAASAAGIPPTQTFQRGAFTFNRRFFETKFPGFFGMVRRDAEKDMVIAIKAARGQYVCNRITRIAANDMHVQVQKGSASEEVMIPFSEIQEIQLKHQDA